jgi:hypothetical protein
MSDTLGKSLGLARSHCKLALALWRVLELTVKIRAATSNLLVWMSFLLDLFISFASG